MTQCKRHARQRGRTKLARQRQMILTAHVAVVLPYGCTMCVDLTLMIEIQSSTGTNFHPRQYDARMRGDATATATATACRLAHRLSRVHQGLKWTH